MAIPKQIFQTFKTDKLPWLTKFHIKRMLKKNPEYEYHFYDDNRIQTFFKNEFPPEYLKAYNRLTIGAAKADFFRYAILYKKGGVYLDVDSGINKPIKKFIREDDVALVTDEIPQTYYVQWGLAYAAGHPFLQRTLEMVMDNIKNNPYPHNVHKTTGPTVYTDAVKACLNEDPTIQHRFMGPHYDNNMQFKYKLGKFFLYSDKSEHWKRKQLTQNIIKPENEDSI
ncbi:glycosyltransferase family 32 protein [Chryseobacterium indoltheticum]|uniref:Mannosyltransferase OCH1 and related enzymes n=1 Tax=Chryseobacterium indoltheticum TaxID=254 RepID=A0A381FAT8_9FLAO|nr:glycosyltransferase [Chryseobacterium indoltheticum]SUX43696.1 Mannosyltransferase OCH1 and related enzymes [Chryseobacterium indoltheticum]